MKKTLLPALVLIACAPLANAASVMSDCSDNTLGLSFMPGEGETCNIEQTLVINGVSEFEAIAIDSEKEIEFELKEGDTVTLTIDATCESADGSATSTFSRTLELSSACPSTTGSVGGTSVGTGGGVDSVDIEAIIAEQKAKREARLAEIKAAREARAAAQNENASDREAAREARLAAFKAKIEELRAKRAGEMPQED